MIYDAPFIEVNVDVCACGLVTCLIGLCVPACSKIPDSQGHKEQTVGTFSIAGVQLVIDQPS